MSATPERLERDRKLILNPVDWPRYPTLPLKYRDFDARKEGYSLFGFLLASRSFLPPGPPFVVHIGPLMMTKSIVDRIKASGLRKVSWQMIVQEPEFQHREFASIDELLAVYTVD